MDRILDQIARRSIEETRAALSDKDEKPHPGVLLARLGDLTRSNSFLLAEGALQAQELYSRDGAAGPAMSRMLVLAIVATDIAVGYTTLRERTRWLPLFVKAKDWELQHQRGAHRILDTAATLGGALIKACQFASTRSDLLPPIYIRTLSTLQDRIPPHPWPAIEEAITKELGKSPQEAFAEIETEPVAAASIAQVHRARLHDGRMVAVKVQYPEIADLVAADLTMLKGVFAALARVVSSMQLRPILDYLQGTLPLELDFRREATAMTDLRTALQHRTDVIVPEVVTELSTDHLLVMEFIDGIKITEREALEQAGISPHEVARLLNDLYAEQMLRLGVLHADPHPGNLLVQPGPKIVLLDHGISMKLSPALIAALTEMVRALVVFDFDRLAKALAGAGLQLDENVDIGTLLQLVGILLGGEKASTDTMEVGTRLSKSISSIPIDLLLVGRALGLLDGITKQLSPDLDTMEIIANYV